MKYSDLENYTYTELEDFLYRQMQNLFVVIDRTVLNMGYFDFVTANRFEENLETVTELLEIAFTPKTWAVGELPRQSDFARWKSALSEIKSAYNVTEIIPPERPFNAWQKWNALEEFLFIVDRIFTENSEQVSYLGEFYCGELGLI